MDVSKETKALTKCAAREVGRYAMHHLKLERTPPHGFDPAPEGERARGSLVATDGRRMVALVVDLAEHDTDGFVTTEALAEACKRAGSNGGSIIANGAQEIVGGPTYPRPPMGPKKDDPNALEFPRWRQIVGEMKRGDAGTCEVTLNAAYLAEMQAALASSDLPCVTIQFRTRPFPRTGPKSDGPALPGLRADTDPIIVRPCVGRLYRGIGVLMPVTPDE